MTKCFSCRRLRRASLNCSPSFTPIAKLRARITLGFVTRLIEVAVFFVFLISQDEQRPNGVVGDEALNGLCIAAFAATTSAFCLKFVQEMFFHKDNVLSLMIQVCLFFVSFCFVLFLFFSSV